MFRPLIHLAVPRHSCLLRHFHSMRPPYTRPQCYDTNFCHPSSNIGPQAHFIRQHQKAAKARDIHVNVNVGPETCCPDPYEYDVVLPDVTHETLRSVVAEELGRPYLSPALEGVVQVGEGCIHGLQRRTIVPLVVTYVGEARWVFFVVDNASPWTYLSAQASEVLGFKNEGGVTIAGRAQTVYVPRATSHFQGVNILGTDFCFTNRIVKVEDYNSRQARLFFGTDWEMVMKPKLGGVGYRECF